MAAMIEVDGLTKRFGPVVAVDNVSMTVARGEVLGFLGPNGAGKSTTMKMISGFLTPTSGTARLCGHDVLDEPLAVKRRLGYLPEGAPTYPDMTVLAFLDWVASVRGFSGAEKHARVERAMRATSLGDVVYYPIEALSKGFKRRVGLAQALLHDPEVLVLDEPTDGLDPNQKHEVRGLITAMAAEKAIVISTHILEEVEAICTRAVVIARGRLVADAAPGALAARSRWHNAVTVRVLPEQRVAAIAALAQLPDVHSVEAEEAPSDGLLAISALPASGVPLEGAVRTALSNAGIAPRDLRIERGRLDEVFRDITTGRPAHPETSQAA
ncbi:ABC transporter ATP-binding protein [Elioraea rosea]|uniref:ABC transporter ATP-binding protein n=1 Tax=Elioraea rosea TaxID=2492390 RepID=UPI0019528AD2|nr:ABC transporter ATP-binding protein [Elioraea rosea]